MSVARDKARVVRACVALVQEMRSALHRHVTSTTPASPRPPTSCAQRAPPTPRTADPPRRGDRRVGVHRLPSYPVAGGEGVDTTEAMYSRNKEGRARHDTARAGPVRRRGERVETSASGFAMSGASSTPPWRIPHATTLTATSRTFDVPAGTPRRRLVTPSPPSLPSLSLVHARPAWLRTQRPRHACEICAAALPTCTAASFSGAHAAHTQTPRLLTTPHTAPPHAHSRSRYSHNPTHHHGATARVRQRRFALNRRRVPRKSAERSELPMVPSLPRRAFATSHTVQAREGRWRRRRRRRTLLPLG